MLTMFPSFSRARAGPLVALVFAASLVAGARADDTVLRYKFTPKPLTYRYVVNSENETTGGMFADKGMKGGMQQAALCVFKAKNSAGDASDVEFTYTAMKMRMDNPMGKPLFIDTTAPAPKEAPKDASKDVGLGDLEGMMSRSLSSVIGKSINVTVDTRGQVTKLEKSDLFSGIEKEVGAKSPAVAASFKQIFSEDNMKDLFRGLFVVLPVGAINPGESWTTTVTTTVPMFGGIKRTLHWTYAGDETVDGRTLAKLTATITMEQTPVDPSAKSPMLKIPGMDMEFVSKEAKGTIVAMFDATAGCLRSMSTTMNMPMTMKMTMPAIGDKPAETRTMKTTGTNSMTMTLVPNGAPLDPDNMVKKPEAAAPVKHE